MYSRLWLRVQSIGPWIPDTSFCPTRCGNQCISQSLFRRFPTRESTLRVSVDRFSFVTRSIVKLPCKFVPYHHFRFSLNKRKKRLLSVVDFYGAFRTNMAGYSASVFVNSALVTSGTAVFFTVRVIPSLLPASSTLQNCLVRISALGDASIYKSPAEITGDSRYTQFPQNLAPAFSVDGSIMYVVVTSDPSGSGVAEFVAMVGVNPQTLEVVLRADNSKMIAPLWDPESGINFPALVSDVSTSSPVVGPDGDVYFGVRGNPNRRSIGWMLHVNRDLSKILVMFFCCYRQSPLNFWVQPHGSAGWDITPSIVPISMINPALYQTNATYLVFIKANNYVGQDCKKKGGEKVLMGRGFFFLTFFLFSWNWATQADSGRPDSNAGRSNQSEFNSARDEDCVSSAVSDAGARIDRRCAHRVVHQQGGC